jgi:hypothetical protein
MEQNEYIKEKMIEFAMNIDDFFIGQEIIDSDKSICKITNKSINSIEVFMYKKTKEGINCKQYFDMKSFNKRFKIK